VTRAGKRDISTILCLDDKHVHYSRVLLDNSSFCETISVVGVRAWAVRRRLPRSAQGGFSGRTDPGMGKEPMDNGRIAAAIIGGYLLGRTKKMKFAIMVGGALMGKKVPTDPAALLKLAGSVVDKSPELQRLDAAVRGRLMEAGKDAALSVASSRMEALTDNLVNRVENLGKPAEAGSDTESDTGSEPEDAQGDVEDAEFEDAPDDDQAPAARAGSTSAGRSAGRGGSAGRNRSTARNGPTGRNGSRARNGSGRPTRRTEAAHD
jgi:hypothetical protein